MTELKDCVNCPYYDDDYGCLSDSFENYIWMSDEVQEDV